MVKALSYVVVSTPKLSEWCDMGTKLMGLHMDPVQTGEAVRMRMDEKVQRLVIQATSGDPTLILGYEVDDKTAFSAIAQRVADAGFAITSGDQDEIAVRGVSDMFHFVDPDGSRLEIACDLATTSAPLDPGRPIGGFRTGNLGMGHVGLMTGNHQAMCALYKNVLGFKLSDSAQKPFPAEFLHINARHHTIGLVDLGTGPAVYHLMMEYLEFDDVGRAYDMALENPDSIGVSLGRHINDHITSFYLRTPDGWMVELGWGGRLIDDDWEIEENLPGMSLWGHDRSWLPQEKRDQAKGILRMLSEKGVRAPVVLPDRTETDS